MTDYTNYVKVLVESIHNICDIEFRDNNYVPPINDNKQPKKFFTNKEKQDISFVKRNIYMTKRTKKLKNTIRENNKNVNEDVSNIKEIEKEKLADDADLLTDKNIFNVIQNENDLLKWKDVKLIKKKEKVKVFIDKYHPELPKELFNKIYELIEKNKINFKKYINYNKLTQIIDDMPIINDIDGYSLNYSTVKKKKRKKIKF